MNAIDFQEANRELHAPEGQEEQVRPLPVHVTNLDGAPVVISCWQPDEEDRKAIERGEPVWLFVYGSHTQPPVMLVAADTVFTHPENGEAHDGD